MKDRATLRSKLDDLMILNFHIYFPIPCLVTECFKIFKSLQHVELDLQFVIREKTVPLHQHESNLVRTTSGRPPFLPPQRPQVHCATIRHPKFGGSFCLACHCMTWLLFEYCIKVNQLQSHT